MTIEEIVENLGLDAWNSASKDINLSYGSFPTDLEKETLRQNVARELRKLRSHYLNHLTFQKNAPELSDIYESFTFNAGVQLGTAQLDSSEILPGLPLRRNTTNEERINGDIRNNRMAYNVVGNAIGLTSAVITAALARDNGYSPAAYFLTGILTYAGTLLLSKLISKAHTGVLYDSIKVNKKNSANDFTNKINDFISKYDNIDK